MTISSLLIANRGEIAVRIARTCRRLGIGTVAVFSDADAGALHVRERDVAVRLPGNAPPTPTSAVDLLIDAARRAGARRRPPRLRLPRRVGAVRPGRARRRARLGRSAAGGDRGDGLEDRGQGADARRRRAGARRRPLPADGTVEAAAVAAIGFPLLVKASAGGGGRGMRIVRSGRRARRRRGGARARGGRGVRRRHGVPRALRRAWPPHRDPGVRRPPRHGGRARRARVLDPAPPPEDHRGVAVAGRRRRPARTVCPMLRWPRREPSATSAPAPSSSCSTRHGRVLLPRDEHPPPGRAPGDRGSSPASTSSSSSCASPRASHCRRPP